jgi:hypothetical protein
VFEPRYQRLVAHCRASDGVIGIATLEPGYEEDYYGRPPIHETLGVGRLVGYEELSDGRSNIVVRFLARARVVEEVRSDEPFRRVRAVAVPDDLAGADAAARSLKRLLVQLLPLLGERVRDLERVVSLDGVPLVDELARRLLVDPDERLACLRSERVAERVRQVEQIVAGFLVRAAPIADA